MRKCLLLLVVLLSAGGAAAAVAAARIEAPRADFDFGQVYAGRKVEHVFPFRNSGDAPLHIEKVRTSCGCTAALVSAKVVPPGGAGEVRVSFDSSRFRGPVHKTVFLYTDAPAQPIFQFNLRGSVAPQLVARPAHLDLGTLAPGGSTRVEVELSNHGEVPITLLGVRTTSPELRASLKPAQLAPGEKTTLTVRAVAGAGRRWLNGYIIIRSKGTGIPEFYLPATLRVE